MNCQSFENIIDDLAREQLVEASARKEALRHSEACAECAVRLADERVLTLGLRSLAGEMQSVEAPDRVERDLLLAFREQQLSRHGARPRRWGYISRVAAVLLVGFAIGVVAWYWGSTPENKADNSATTIPFIAEAAPSLSPAAPVLAPVSLASPGTAELGENLFASQKPANHGVRGRTGRQKLAVRLTDNVNSASDSNTEVATDFMPLGYVNSLSLQDGGSVVRIELSRSTIASMGFAVNMDREGERVKADVLMGADGLARAIRFVQ